MKVLPMAACGDNVEGNLRTVVVKALDNPGQPLQVKLHNSTDAQLVELFGPLQCVREQRMQPQTYFGVHFSIVHAFPQEL